jgi:hypothetical protein
MSRRHGEDGRQRHRFARSPQTALRGQFFAHGQLIIVIHLKDGDRRPPLRGDTDDPSAIPQEMF